MRKVIYSYVVSLEGSFESPDGTFDWAYPGEELHQHFNDLEASDIDTHLYGRVMWEGMVGAWPTAAENTELPRVEREYGEIWVRAKKYVFSKTLESVEEGATLVRGDAGEAVRAIKAAEGKDISVGGARLAISLANEGLVDEFRVYVAPVLLGGGRKMFDGLDRRISLELVETRVFGSGVVMLRYSAS